MSAAAPYLIGRILDPIYAIAIGTGAAVVRIRREEKEKGRSSEQSLEVLKRRVNLWMNRGDGQAPGGTKKARS